jgi:hypothetical protein
LYITEEQFDPNVPTIVLEFENPARYIINDNIFCSFGDYATQTPVFIKLANDPDTISNCTIVNNQFVAFTSVSNSIVLETSTACEIRKNLHVYFAAPSATYNLGTSTNLIIGRPMCLRYMSGSDFIASSGSNHEIPFNEYKFQLPFVGSDGNPTNSLQVPAGLGYRRCKLCAQVHFSTQAGGIRQVTLLKNGSSNFIGTSSAFIGTDQNVSPQTPYIQLTSTVVSIVDNDYFQLQFFQDSGLDITVFVEDTWMQIQIID